MAMCWFIQAAASALQLAAPATCSLALSVGSPRAGPYLLQLPLGVHGSTAAQARCLLTSLAGWASWPARSCPSFRSEEHTSELQSLMRISYAVFCLKKKTKTILKQNTQS